MRSCREPHHVPRPTEREALERRARERLESLQNRYFSDDEWEVVRKRLREFFLVLQDWSKR